MHGNTVSLIGLGLLGGSLGKAMLQGGLAKRVLGLVRREESIQQAQEAGIVPQAYLEPQEAVQEADLIILCTPVLQIPALMEKMLPHLRPGTLVTDVGSVKRELVDHLEPLLTSAGCIYIGSHPMAGSERHGLEHADPNLFLGATCVITPTATSPDASVQTIMQFWESVGGQPLIMEAAQHDQWVAHASHLPHAVAAMLAWRTLDPAQGALQAELCSTGFRDTTRVASGSPEMWADILISNRSAIGQSLQSHQEQCTELKQWLENNDRASILEWLAESKMRRDQWLESYSKRQPTMKGPRPPARK